MSLNIALTFATNTIRDTMCRFFRYTNQLSSYLLILINRLNKVQHQSLKYYWPLRCPCPVSAPVTF